MERRPLQTFINLALWMSLPLAVTGCNAATPKAEANSGTPGASELPARLAALKARTLQDLVFVKGGTFTMGDFGPIHHADKLPYSGPPDDDVLREVTLDSYSIAAHKVTYADFDVFTDATGKPRIAQQEMDLGYRNLPGIPAGVNWFDARAYCQWIGSQVSLPMDLATEAQWEYAARSRGQMVVYPTDDGQIENGRNVGNYGHYEKFEMDRNVNSWFTSVGEFPPNPLGLHDMIDHGYEWVQDWYAPAYDPKDTRNPKGPAQGTEKVQRAHSDRGGDSLFIVSMTFTRFHKVPSPMPQLDPYDDTPIPANQNKANTIRCVANAQRPLVR